VDEARRVLDAAIDAAISERLRLHRERREKRLTVPEYKAGLKAVRDVEDTLEPLRRVAGATQSRRFELHGDPPSRVG
jgi:hypothetical protein